MRNVQNVEGAGPSLTKKLLTETIPENIFEKSIEIQYNRTRIESFGIYLHNYRPILHNFTFSKGD